MLAFRKAGKAPKPTEKASIARFQSGLIIKSSEGVQRIRGTAYDPDTEKVLGAWGEVVIEGVEYYSSVNPSKKTKLDELCAIALGQALAQSEIRNTDQLLSFLKLQLGQRR